MLDGVHIYVDERGLVEEAGDLAVTVDAGVVPLVVIKNIGPNKDTLRVYSLEPISVEPTCRSLWVDGSGMWSDDRVVVEPTLTAAAPEVQEAAVTTDEAAIDAARVEALTAENAQLRDEIAHLKVRVENTKTRNKRLEAKLASSKKPSVTEQT